MPEAVMPEENCSACKVGRFVIFAAAVVAALFAWKG